MPLYVVDASTVLAALFAEAHSALAEAFFDDLSEDEDQLLAPAFLFAECTSNIREKVHLGLITEAEGTQKLQEALRLPIRQISDLEQHSRALQMASARKTAHAYDEHYIAVAALENAELVTIDSGMYQGAVNFKVAARLLK